VGFSPPILAAIVALFAFSYGARADGHFPDCVMQLRGIVSSADDGVSYPNGALLIHLPRSDEGTTFVRDLDWQPTSSGFAESLDALEALRVDPATPISVARCNFSTLERICVFTYFAATEEVQAASPNPAKGPTLYMFPTLSDNCIAPPD
jgi:hypothetical protein